MIFLSKKNINEYIEQIRDTFVSCNGGFKELLKKLEDLQIKTSKTSLYRLLKDSSFYKYPEVVEICTKTERIVTFLKSIKTEELTVEDIQQKLNQNFRKFSNKDYNILDTFSILKRYFFKYKKKDLSKKCYKNSKRVKSKYSESILKIKEILINTEKDIKNYELSQKLFSSGFSDNGKPFNINKIAHMKRYLFKEKTPRGLTEIQNYVESKKWLLLKVIDSKNNVDSVKGKTLQLKCPAGHFKEVTLSRFVQNIKCAECEKNKKAAEYEDKVKKYFTQQKYIYLGKGTRKTEFYAKCEKGHEFLVLFNNFKKKNSCPTCFHEIHGFSLSEKEVVTYIKSIYAGEILENNFKIIPPKELDIYLPEKNLAIEYCGLYFHSVKCFGYEKAKKYHRHKYEECLKKGIKLLTIFEDEWQFKEEICKSRIKNYLGLSEKVFARNLTLEVISKEKSQTFFNNNHLQEYKSSKITFGLVKENKIYCALSLSDTTRKHTVKQKTIEIKRFASLLGFQVVGGFSRLLKYAEAWAKNSGYLGIRTHCDLRWGTGNVYAKTGFNLIFESKSTPHYIVRLNRIRNMSLRKTKEERLLNISEINLRISQGYNVIFDCGHTTWEKPIK